MSQRSSRNKTIAAVVGVAAAVTVIVVGVLVLRPDTTDNAQGPVDYTAPDIERPPVGNLTPEPTLPAPDTQDLIPDNAVGKSFPEFEIIDENLIEAPRPDTFDPNIPLPPPAPSQLPTESPLDVTDATYIESIDVPYLEGFTTRQWKYALDPPGQSYADVCNMLRSTIQERGYEIITEECQEGVLVMFIFKGPNYTGFAAIVSDNYIVIEAR